MEAGLGVRPTAGSFAGRIAGAKAVAAVDRILLLDDVWTQATTSLIDQDRATIAAQLDDLGTLVDDMDRALADVEQQLGELRMVLDSAASEHVDAALAALTRDNLAAQDLLREVFVGEMGDVDPRGAMLFATIYLVEETPRERDLLQSKLQVMRDGGPPDPDLRPGYRCALTLAGIGGLTAATLLTHGLVAVIAALADRCFSDLLSWQRSGCPEAWRAITRGRL